MALVGKLKVKVPYGTDGKASWVKVGVMFERDDGTKYVSIDKHINFAGFDSKDGRNDVIANIFEDEEDDVPKQQAKQAVKKATPRTIIEYDDVPF